MENRNAFKKLTQNSIKKIIAYAGNVITKHKIQLVIILNMFLFYL